MPFPLPFSFFSGRFGLPVIGPLIVGGAQDTEDLYSLLPGKDCSLDRHVSFMVAPCLSPLSVGSPGFLLGSVFRISSSAVAGGLVRIPGVVLLVAVSPRFWARIPLSHPSPTVARRHAAEVVMILLVLVSLAVFIGLSGLQFLPALGMFRGFDYHGR